MRYVVLNSYAGYGSTGRLAEEACKRLEQEGHTAVLCHGRKKVNCEAIKTYRIDSPIEVVIHGILARVFDNQGLNSRFATYRFLNWMDKYKPDVILMNNIHGYYLNYPMLFNYIKKNNIKVEWTLHDCWAMTGHCAYFTAAGCDKWKTQCKNCPEKRSYPSSYLFDCSQRNYQKKKDAFTGVKNLKIIVPSKWLKGLVEESYLSEYPVEVRYNKIDKSIFKPTPSTFKKDHGIEDKIMLLGVASDWSPRKGLNDFLELSKRIDDRFVIVLVGLTDKQKKKLNLKIIPIAKTNNTKELAKIYSSADIFLNPSKEETFGMTTVESQLCGTNVIVYKNTACEEVAESSSGTVIEPGVESIICELEKIYGPMRNSGGVK